MAPLCALPRLLEDHGLDADSVIREVGCDPALFRDPENTIDFTAVGRLLAHTARVTGYPYPGLELGRHLGLDVLGAMGASIRHAPDIGTALRTLILYFHLHDRGAIPALWESRDRAMFGYTLYCPRVPGTDHIYDAALAISHNVLSELAGRRWKALEVRFFRDPPEDMQPYHRHFRTRLCFGTEHAAIVFPAAELVRPLEGADQSAFTRALRKLEAMNDASDASLLGSKIRRLLYHTFIGGSGPDVIDLQGVARRFALHPRTLNRRLHVEGTTFNELLSETRFAVARQLLRDTNLRTTEIAAILGYAESASFDHAFRRWSGTTASEWRSSCKPGRAAHPD